MTLYNEFFRTTTFGRDRTLESPRQLHTFAHPGLRDRWVAARVSQRKNSDAGNNAYKYPSALQHLLEVHTCELVPASRGLGRLIALVDLSALQHGRIVGEYIVQCLSQPVEGKCLCQSKDTVSVRFLYTMLTKLPS